MIRKLVILILLMVFFCTMIINSSEIKFKFQNDEALRINEIYKTSNKYFINYERDNIKIFGRRAGLGMAITGTVLVGTSFFLTIPGIALMAYGYANRWTYWRTYYTYNYYYGYYEDLTLVYVGAGVFTLGLIMLFTGLPLMIVGFIIYSKKGRRTSVFIDGDNSAANMGIKIKI